MEMVMKKWYAMLSGKKVLGAGLAAVVTLTVLLAVSFYRTRQPREEEKTARETVVQTQEAPSGNTQELAEEMNHELPVGNEVGEQQLADQEKNQSTSEADGKADLSGELAEVAGQSSLVSMNLSFDGTQKLQWPVAGRQLVKEYSMDSLVYYSTLKEYKVSPAIMVQAQPGDAVLAPGDGLVTEIGTNEEIGNYIRLKLGEHYEALIGNMDNISVQAGDYLMKGTVLGGLASPTKYYLTEGPNLYLELLMDGEPVDPLDYLE